jgi:magnesium transporter
MNSIPSTSRWQSPGSLIYTGEKKVDRVKISVIEYNADSYSEREVDDLNELKIIQGNEKVSWINVCGLHEIEKIEKIGNYFDLHSLLLEDILNIKHTPKIDNYDDYLFIIAKMIDLNSIKGLNIEQISFVLKGNTLLTFQEDEEDVFNTLRDRIRKNIGRIRKSGSDYLMYRLLDSIVDGYFVVSESIEDRIEAVEDKIILNTEEVSIETIHNLRKEVSNFRRAVYPLRDIVYSLQRERDRHIKKSTFYFIRDLYDHLQNTIDSIEIFRENIKGILDLHLSGSSKKLNEIIKVLTIISTIFIPLTFIVGIYGMNFNTDSPWNMPELNWRYGYLFIMIFMFLTAVSLIIFVKKKKWI